MSAFPNFEVVPAVDMEGGEVVQLVQGERGTEKRYGDPVDAARRWVEQGARTLHLVDLDGAFDGTQGNAGAVSRIVEARDAGELGGDVHRTKSDELLESEAPQRSGDRRSASTTGADGFGDGEVSVQLGGGIRTAADAREILESGVDRVILGTAAVENPDIVGEINRDYPGTVVVSLDARDGEVVVSGWTEGTGLDPAEAAGRYEELGAAAILFTDVDVEGQLEGVRTEPVERMVDAVDVPVIASGGVTTLDDVRALRDAGAAAVVVGTALYEGKFTLAEAIEELD